MAEAATSRLMVILFTDIVGSVDLKTRLGAPVASALISRHDEIFRAVMATVSGAEIQKDTGDGFLASFATASDAVSAALLFQDALRREPWSPEPVRVCVGIHIGQVTELAPEVTGRRKLSGLAVDVAARVMGLAQPGQILLTRTAFDDARQYVREHPQLDHAAGADETPLPELRWMAHGPYLFKGADEPMVVCEVGAEGVAPLAAPPDSEKARRAIAAGDEETLGWRPATGLPIPQRKGWKLDHKLGEGGFGEVWLAEHRRTMTRRVFKFCFNADKLRSLKRELTLFRLLREALGDRQDIARLYDVQLDEAPFFLESEFTEGGSLLEWAESRGGLEALDLQTRIDFVARTARAVAAAHSVGILHKDIKPGNVLVYEENGDPRPRLADFGIGTVTDETLAGRPITMAGFTISPSTRGESMTGTQMYAPPESLAGRPFTALGDVYALGVLLYQMAVGDLERPLAQGWERDVHDQTLVEDIAVCIEGDVDQRLGSAQGLAKRLETLPERRRAARRRKIMRFGALASGVLVVLVAIMGWLAIEQKRLHEKARYEADKALAVNRFLKEMFISSDPMVGQSKETKVKDVLDDAARRIPEDFRDQPDIRAALLVAIGTTYKNLGFLEEAVLLLRQSLQVRRSFLEPPHADLAESLHELAAATYFAEGSEAAEPIYVRALEMRRALYGEEHPEIADTLDHLAFVRDDETLHRRALEMRLKLLPPDHKDVARSYNNLGNYLREHGRCDDAEPLLDKALAIMQSIHGEVHGTIAVILSRQARCQGVNGNDEEAERLLRRVLSIKRETLGVDHPRTAESLHDLAEQLHRMGQDDEAARLCREAIAVRRAKLPEGHPDIRESEDLLTEITAGR